MHGGECVGTKDLMEHALWPSTRRRFCLIAGRDTAQLQGVMQGLTSTCTVAHSDAPCRGTHLLGALSCQDHTHLPPLAILGGGGIEWPHTSEIYPEEQEQCDLFGTMPQVSLVSMNP